MITPKVLKMTDELVGIMTIGYDLIKKANSENDEVKRNEVMDSMFEDIGYALAYLTQEDWDNLRNNRSDNRVDLAYDAATLCRYHGTGYLASEITGSFLYAQRWPHCRHQEWEQVIFTVERHHLGDAAARED